MIKLAKVLNEENGKVSIAQGTDTAWFISQGYSELDVQQSDVDYDWYLTNKCPMKTEEEKQQEELERIAMLNLTGADVERGIYKATGMDFEDIVAFVEAQPLSEGGQPVVDIKALKIELKANNFYRGSVWVNTVGTMLGFTSKQLDLFFEDGNYEHLISFTENETKNEV